jgi:hypothetical protein
LHSFAEAREARLEFSVFGVEANGLRFRASLFD